VVLMAKVLHPASIPVRQTCWYVKVFLSTENRST
jgi:hypothetical protein